MRNIRTPILEASIRKHHKHSIRILGRQVPISVLAILVCGMLVSGALVTILWQQATVNIQGNIDVNGQTEEISELFYDGTRITGDLTLTTMDIESISYGETLAFPHLWENNNGHTVHIDLDTSGMPINGGGVPESLWYGFNIEFLDGSTMLPITEFDMGAISEKTIIYRFTCDELFAEPTIPFPFLLTYNIERTDKQQYSMGYGGQWGDMGDIYMHNVGGTLYTVSSYDESTILTSIDNPSSSADWTTVYSDVSAVNYEHPYGLQLTANTGSLSHKAIVKDFTTQDGYTITTTLGFDSRLNDAFVIWHYIDSGNYFTASLNRVSNTVSLVQYLDGTPTTLWSGPYTILSNTPIALKLMVDTDNKEVSFYVGGTLQTTLSFV